MSDPADLPPMRKHVPSKEEKRDQEISRRLGVGEPSEFVKRELAALDADAYIVDHHFIRLLIRLKARLYCEQRMNGDEMRDFAQAIDARLKEKFPADKETLESRLSELNESEEPDGDDA